MQPLKPAVIRPAIMDSYRRLKARRQTERGRARVRIYVARTGRQRATVSAGHSALPVSATATNSPWRRVRATDWLHRLAASLSVLRALTGLRTWCGSCTVSFELRKLPVTNQFFFGSCALRYGVGRSVLHGTTRLGELVTVAEIVVWIFWCRISVLVSIAIRGTVGYWQLHDGRTGSGNERSFRRASRHRGPGNFLFYICTILVDFIPHVCWRSICHVWRSNRRHGWNTLYLGGHQPSTSRQLVCDYDTRNNSSMLWYSQQFTNTNSLFVVVACYEAFWINRRTRRSTVV